MQLAPSSDVRLRHHMLRSGHLPLQFLTFAELQHLDVQGTTCALTNRAGEIGCTRPQM
ncbi:hypothetical protein J4O75_22280 [Paenibacillus pabuli]